MMRGERNRFTKELNSSHDSRGIRERLAAAKVCERDFSPTLRKRKLETKRKDENRATADIVTGRPRGAKLLARGYKGEGRARERGGERCFKEGRSIDCVPGGEKR